jgi:hypothetical protein
MMADKSEKARISDKIIGKAYRDYDSYDWSGKQVDKGVDVRKKGSDR